MFDLIIRNGTVVDGTGDAARTADVAVVDGKIVDVRPDLAGEAATEIDASGQLVAPGFVDVHTHYDGQATWDEVLEPSTGHGVTTLVMGNCGVGFAPVHPGKEDWLIQLMEGVEDIPGSALSEGISWGWETFGEYLDVLDSRRFSVDVGTQVPHGAVRAYVMGERGARNEPATAADIEAMHDIVADAIDAGALGFSTSRTLGHRAIDGEPVPGTYAGEDELFGIAQALKSAGRGVFELAPALDANDAHDPVGEVDWMGRLSADIERPVTFAAVQVDQEPDMWRKVMEESSRHADQGAVVRPQVAARPFGMLLGLQTHHPFGLRPTYQSLAQLPLDERVSRLREPAIRRAILSEADTEPDPGDIFGALPLFLQAVFPKIFEIGDPPDYEPTADRSISSLAEVAGADPLEIAYDLLLGDDGRALLLYPVFNYSNGNQDDLREMMTHPLTLLGLGDGGAHCGMICDASIQTYTLTHWARDRTRGPKLDLEWLIHKQTQQTAELFGFTDRGILAPGKRADINVIDHEALTLRAPHLVHDLPAGGRRLVQEADGYRATIVAGEVTRRGGADTGARPGRLVRGS